jgi:hypothetical protein
MRLLDRVTSRISEGPRTRNSGDFSNHKVSMAIAGGRSTGVAQTNPGPVSTVLFLTDLTLNGD